MRTASATRTGVFRAGHPHAHLARNLSAGLNFDAASSGNGMGRPFKYFREESGF
jgi:hypothetical protein